MIQGICFFVGFAAIAWAANKLAGANAALICIASVACAVFA